MQLDGVRGEEVSSVESPLLRRERAGRAKTHVEVADVRVEIGKEGLSRAHPLSEDGSVQRAVAEGSKEKDRERGVSSLLRIFL